MAKKTEVIKFLKIREVKSPSRAYPFDAGIDFFVPEFKKEFIKDLKEKNSLVFEDSKEKAECCSGTYTFTSTTICITGNSSKVEYDLSDENDTLIKFDEKMGENYFILPPHSRIMIPSGIKSRMAEPGRALIAANKSGVATKHGLLFGAQVVDYTYKGEIHLSLINTSTKNVRIYENMKILQFVETPVFNSPVEIIEKDESGFVEINFYDGLENDRGIGGFGSTDKK